MKDKISEIKKRMSCVEFAQRNNLPINKSGDRCVSPLRLGASNSTSFIVYDDFFFDFGSSEGGDVIDFAAMLLFNNNKGDAIRHLAQLTGVSLSNHTRSAEWIEYTQSLNGKIQKWHENLLSDDREYLHRRGITDTTINNLKIGRTENGRLCIPYWKNGYIAYYATRHMPGGAYPESKYMKMPIDDHNEHTVWGLHTLSTSQRDTLVIAEGAFDALSFEQEGYPTISAITGHFSRSQMPQALSIARSFKRVFLVYDNDTRTGAGEKFTIKMTRILIENRIPCIVGKVPPLYKDVSEYYADGGSLAELISNATDGISFLAEKITDFDDFETYARRVCRYMTKPKVDMFFKPFYDKFPPDAVKTLQKECKSAPMDKLIADEILSRHTLIYNPRVSFFEYNNKFWEAKSDTQIESYIADCLGPYATGPRISSCLRVIKSRIFNDTLMNTKPVVNFINGTLELLDDEPYYIFREWRMEDYCDYCLDYPYKPNVRSIEWEAYIDSVTDNNDSRRAFLQEFAGYILFADNSLHKACVLVGKGGNGKSIYMKALKNVFGSTNVVNIEASELHNPFRAINLQRAMLEISEEVKDDLSASEAMIKKIVSGDTINACYKGKDFIDFEPRCKMILSFNNYPRISDKSDGIMRRLMFVEFPITFTENPVAANERPLDTSLESKFADQEQLTRIFNWVLDGYVSVKRYGTITVADEHRAKLEEFKEESDPIITFVKEFTYKGYISNDDLYKKYKWWCEDNNYRAESSLPAKRRINAHMKNFRPEVEIIRKSKEKGYIFN